MSTSVRDLRDTIVPKSDQLNADQLLGGPITVTVTDVRRGGGEDQPIVIHYDGEGGRPYKPCKSMRKVLVFAWGSDGREWIGRSMTLYNRPDVKFGGEEVGGIRISHLSDIDRDVAISLTATRGRKEQTRIKRLDKADTVQGSRSRLEAAARGGMDSLKSAWASIPSDHKTAISGTQGCPAELKQIAEQADARTASMQSGGTTDAPKRSEQAQDVHDALVAAKTEDALNDAWDLSRELSQAEQQELLGLYQQRALDLKA
jgi:hypothetical protein